mmetsp:Transcript_23619/g.41871  ORF Transcript_23619/g.41871 Transcript_23619/m.41871 type:complete len:299 (+) Transcript_23619:2259-3155(+)
MAGQGQILGRGTELHRHANLVDQVARRRTDDVRPENTVGLRVSENFHKPVAGEIGLGAPIAHKAEFADFVFAALLFQGFFGLAHVADLRMGVDHTGDHVIVHVAMMACDLVGGGHAFVLGLVREHRPFDYIANRVDTRDVRLPMGIHLDLTALRHLDPKRLKPQPVHVRFAPCGHQHHVRIDHVFALILAQFVVDFGLGLGRLDLLHCGPHGKADPLLFQDLLELALYFDIHAGGDGIKEFDHLDFRAQSFVDRTQLQPDDARADHDHLFGHLAQFKRAGGGHDDFLVDLDAWQAGGL